MGTSVFREFYNLPFPALDIGEDYTLREQRPSDVETFYQYYKNPLVGRYILASKPTSLSQARQEIQHCYELFYKKKGLYWAVCALPQDRIIGCIGLYINIRHSRAEICYDLSAKYWQKGIMSRAVRAVLDYAFKNIQLTRIEANLVKENIASVALLKKMGFAHEGTLRQHRYYQGQFHDVEMYSLIRPNKSHYQIKPNFQAVMQQALSS